MARMDHAARIEPDASTAPSTSGAVRARTACGQGCPDPDRDRHPEEDGAEAGGREQREAREFLCDLRLERIDRAEGGADRRRRRGYSDGGHRVEPQSARHEQQHRHQGDDLFLHLHQHPGQPEEETGDRNDQPGAVRQPADQELDDAAKGAGPVHDRERAAHQEDEGDYHRRRLDAARNRRHGVERPDRCRGQGMVGAGDGHLAAGGRILPAVELAGRNQVGKQGREEDAADQEGQRVGKAKRHGPVTASCRYGSPAGPGRRRSTRSFR